MVRAMRAATDFWMRFMMTFSSVAVTCQVLVWLDAGFAISLEVSTVCLSMWSAYEERQIACQLDGMRKLLFSREIIRPARVRRVSADTGTSVRRMRSAGLRQRY